MTTDTGSPRLGRAAPTVHPARRQATTMDRHAWDTTVAFAAALVQAGADADAVGFLAGPLSTLDPATTGPDHLVIAAATLYARSADPRARLVPDVAAWATYAHQAARTLHGLDHPATIEATDVLARILHGRDRYTEADALRRDLIQLHLDRGDVDTHLKARMDLAVQLHGAGRCGEAVRQAHAAWQEWTTRHDPTAEASAPIALQLLGMLLACGRTVEAEAVIDAVDPHLPAEGDLVGSVYHEFLTFLAASRVLHRATCARNRDRTPTTGVTSGVAERSA